MTTDDYIRRELAATRPNVRIERQPPYARAHPDCPVCFVPDKPGHRDTALHDKRQGEAWDAEALDR